MPLPFVSEGQWRSRCCVHLGTQGELQVREGHSAALCQLRQRGEALLRVSSESFRSYCFTRQTRWLLGDASAESSDHRSCSQFVFLQQRAAVKAKPDSLSTNILAVVESPDDCHCPCIEQVESYCMPGTVAATVYNISARMSLQ